MSYGHYAAEDLLEARARYSAVGVAQGAQIRTSEGDLPVEYLCPGDRIVTRSGMRVLRAVTVQHADRHVLRFPAGSLGQGRPQSVLYLGAQTRMPLGGWRAQTLYEAETASVPASKLCDGQVVRVALERPVRLYALHFDTVETFFAEGIEVEAQVVPATA
ncbi:Hint domain-containing protein [Thioclava sp. GXIMD4216]|uniref:Hint domain-containing protein n=1 Tax=Thioclava litoralis TaxID=3076557 RepID=A0ABZ1E198_9RHOB|nr:Hint domain-containing protein [Thioclava sp. FTW29]